MHKNITLKPVAKQIPKRSVVVDRFSHLFRQAATSGGSASSHVSSSNANARMHLHVYRLCVAAASCMQARARDTSQPLRSVCFLSQKFTAALSSLSPTQTAGRMSEQPPYVAFVQQPASVPSSGGLQVQVGARIERQEERVDWSVSPFVVTALMPRDAGNKGLRIGDRILSINGESVTHMPTSDALSHLLTGPLGSSVDIVVDRATCTPQPLALSVPRSSIEEHFGGKVFGTGDVIFEGWIAKDGRFSSAYKRRWARLSVRIEVGGLGSLTASSYYDSFFNSAGANLAPLDSWKAAACASRRLLMLIL